MPSEYGLVRAAARLLIGPLIQQGLGSNAIIRQLQGIGMSYQRTVMLADIRSFSGMAKLETTVRKIAGDLVFPQYGMVESTLRRARKYRIYGTLTLEDQDTWETTQRHVSFYSDDRRSKDDWEAEVMDLYEGGIYEEARRINLFEITSVEHQRGWNY